MRPQIQASLQIQATDEDGLYIQASLQSKRMFCIIDFLITLLHVYVTCLCLL